MRSSVVRTYVHRARPCTFTMPGHGFWTVVLVAATVLVLNFLGRDDDDTSSDHPPGQDGQQAHPQPSASRSSHRPPSVHDSPPYLRQPDGLLPQSRGTPQQPTPQYKPYLPDGLRPQSRGASRQPTMQSIPPPRGSTSTYTNPESERVRQIAQSPGFHPPPHEQRIDNVPIPSIQESPMQISRARDMQGKVRGERGRGRASSRPLSTRADHLRVQTESYDEITTGDSPLNASLRSSTIPAPATVRGVRGRGRASERSLSTRAYRGRASSRPLSTRANHLRVQTELYDETTTGDSLLNASLHSSAIPAPATAVPPSPHPQPASNRADNDALQQALNLRAAAREMNNPQRDFLDGLASTIIFEENNKLVKSDEIDLHGLFVREAQLKVDEAISQRERRGDRRVLFIVGQGKNSDGGVPKLKPNLMEYIEKMPREVKEHPGNPGKLVVTLLGNQSSMPLPVPVLVG